MKRVRVFGIFVELRAPVEVHAKTVFELTKHMLLHGQPPSAGWIVGSYAVVCSGVPFIVYHPRSA
jgi:hypothetical protein